VRRCRRLQRARATLLRRATRLARARAVDARRSSGFFTPPPAIVLPCALAPSTLETSRRRRRRLPRPLPPCGWLPSAGRNNIGQVSTWHRGGGNVRKYRVIDFKRNGRLDEPAVVERLEYDPNRSAHIALIRYVRGSFAEASRKPRGSLADGAAASLACRAGSASAHPRGAAPPPASR
jgi:hypothetical protein